jgi:hypothetical protein
MRVARVCAKLLVLVAVLSGCAPDPPFDAIEIRDQLTDLLELHTYEHIYRDVVYFGEEKSFLFVRTVDRRILFSIDIRVRAGVDLQAGIRVTRDQSNPSRVYVQLPATEILSVDADEASIHEYFIREQGGRIGLLELTGQLEEVKSRVASDAVERGILASAESNAKRIVRNFFFLAGFTEVLFAPDRQSSDEGIRG